MVPAREDSTLISIVRTGYRLQGGAAKVCAMPELVPVEALDTVGAIAQDS